MINVIKKYSYLTFFLISAIGCCNTSNAAISGRDVGDLDQDGCGWVDIGLTTNCPIPGPPDADSPLYPEPGYTQPYRTAGNLRVQIAIHGVGPKEYGKHIECITGFAGAFAQRECEWREAYDDLGYNWDRYCPYDYVVEDNVCYYTTKYLSANTNKCVANPTIEIEYSTNLFRLYEWRCKSDEPPRKECNRGAPCSK